MSVSPRRAKAAGAVVALLALAAAGAWFWQKYLAPTPLLPRQPLGAGAPAATPLPLDLEAFLPAGAYWVAGAPAPAKAFDSLHASHFYAQYDVLRSSAQEQAARAYGKLAAGQADRTLEEASRLLGRGFVLALYPRPAQPVIAFGTPQAQSNILLVSRVALPFSWTGSPLEPLLRMATDDVYRDVPLKVLPFAAVGVAEVSGQGYLLASNDAALVRRSIELLGTAPGVAPAMAREAWLTSAARRVPADSFLYLMASDQAMRQALRPRSFQAGLPNTFDWSAMSFSWDAGLHASGYAHFDAGMDPVFAQELKSGPAAFPVLDLLPSGGVFALATNSFDARSSLAALRKLADAATTLPKPVQQALGIKWEDLAGVLGEQAAVGVVLADGPPAAGEAPLGVYAVYELRRPFSALDKVETVLAQLGGALLSVKAVNSVGDCGALALGDTGRSVLLRVEGRWLVAASDERTMQSAVAALRRRAPALKIPADYAAPANVLGFLDYGAAAKGVQRSRPGQEQQSALYAWLTSLKPGWFSLTHEQEGSAYRFDLPLEDASDAEWAQRLAPLQPMLERSAMVNARAKALALTGQALAQLRVALFNYRKARRAFPRTLSQLAPRYIKAVPADPVTGATRSVPAPDAGGGWLYDPRSGAVALNTSRPELGVVGPASAGAASAAVQIPPSDRATLQALGLMRLAVFSYRARNGKFPDSLSQLGTLPMIDTHAHPPSRDFNIYASRMGPLKDTGGWGYVADHNSREWGLVFIDCTQPDSRGRPWYQY